MQKVAAYALFASFKNNEDAKSRFNSVGNVVQGWLTGKGQFRLTDEGRELVLHTTCQATTLVPGGEITHAATRALAA